jgi:hypothetical protein
LSDLSLADGLRFVFSGVIAYLYLYLLTPSTAQEFALTAGTLGFPLVLAVVGSAIYFLYRPLVYDPLIERVQSRFLRGRPNYRQFLVAEYCISFSEAGLLWTQIRDLHLVGRYKTLRVQAAGIHMTYLAGLLALPFVITAAARGETCKAGLFLTIALVSGIAGFLNDASFEEIECSMLKSVARENRDTVATNLGYTRRSPQADRTVPATDAQIS